MLDCLHRPPISRIVLCRIANRNRRTEREGWVFCGHTYHHCNSTGFLSNACLFDVNNVHDDSTLEHLGESDLRRADYEVSPRHPSFVLAVHARVSCLLSSFPRRFGFFLSHSLPVQLPIPGRRRGELDVDVCTRVSFFGCPRRPLLLLVSSRPGPFVVVLCVDRMFVLVVSFMFPWNLRWVGCVSSKVWVWCWLVDVRVLLVLFFLSSFLRPSFHVSFFVHVCVVVPSKHLFVWFRRLSHLDGMRSFLLFHGGVCGEGCVESTCVVVGGGERATRDGVSLGHPSKIDRKDTHTHTTVRILPVPTLGPQSKERKRK